MASEEYASRRIVRQKKSDIKTVACKMCIRDRHCRIMAAAGHGMWRYVKRRWRNRRTGNATLNVVARQGSHQAASTLFLPSFLALYNASSTRLNNSSILSLASCRATPILTVKRGRPGRLTLATVARITSARLSAASKDVRGKSSTCLLYTSRCV